MKKLNEQQIYDVCRLAGIIDSYRKRDTFDDISKCGFHEILEGQVLEIARKNYYETQKLPTIKEAAGVAKKQLKEVVGY